MKKIHFENMGQDLEWIVVKDGKIVDVSPNISEGQRKFWLKRPVENKEFIAGSAIKLGEGRMIKYKTSKIEEIPE